MTVRLAKRFDDLQEFQGALLEGRVLPFSPTALDHLYVKLDFQARYENARNSEDARGFLRSIARAATAAYLVAAQHGGVLLEVQGSLMHVAVPSDPAGQRLHAATAAADLHRALQIVFADPRSRIDGWRMTADCGRTMLVAGRGVHGDDSLVSLGAAANRPAKHMYAQLELAEQDRRLKRFHLGIREPRSGHWLHQTLDRTPVWLTESVVKSIGEQVRASSPVVDYAARMVTAQAYPIAPAGSPGSPLADSPEVLFGWVMRADLDGFTAEVESCMSDDQALAELASGFYRIMDAAASFVEEHRTEALIQLPWAGDNFTVAAVFRRRADYDQALAQRLVDLVLDFKKELNIRCDGRALRRWAYSAAGGEPHANSGGNVYVGSVEAGGRRFLVGAGEGFGRSAKAFGDINPSADEMVIYEPDWAQLDDDYRRAFEKAVTHRGQQSSLFRKAEVGPLERVRARRAAAGTPTVITRRGGAAATVIPRPYSP